MTDRERFLAACRQKNTGRPPLWIMRQAGRYLPEYRKLKEQYSFLEMVKTPELATTVTLQPLKRFELDAAILFSDILTVPEALGFPYSFVESGGIRMKTVVRDEADVKAFQTGAVAERLSYIPDALKLIRRELGDKKALLGFVGSPWTLATYLVEGGSSKNFTQAKQMLYSNPKLFHSMMDKITEAVSISLDLQIEAGVDAVQIFDSWGGVLTPDTFPVASGIYMKKIVDKVAGRVPVIVFSKGSHTWLNDLKNTGADVLGFDWTVNLSNMARLLNGTTAVQGNLDPALMNLDPDIVTRQAQNLLNSMKTYPGFIFNLGHGILPTARLESVEALVDTVRNFSSERNSK